MYMVVTEKRELVAVRKGMKTKYLVCLSTNLPKVHNSKIMSNENEVTAIVCKQRMPKFRIV